MSNSGSGSGIGHIAKALLITTLKLLAIATAFSLKVIGAACTAFASLLEKISGSHGSGH